MNRLASLKAAASLHALALVLGYKAKGLAYVVHGISDTAKYKDFQIPKRSGGFRTISAPIPELKRLQKHLAKLLDDCIADIDTARGVKNNLSHGFRRKHSIMTNAAVHRGRRYVFNIDLHDFFGTINFGRVWRFFEKHREFKLNPSVARTIAQIACHNKALPQGSPCSPVISNLIGHVLDMRMVQLAAKVGCHYSRYADDLTFSTNKKDFPSSIATKIDETTQWAPGKALIREINRCGFAINPTKTRMQLKDFRQDVTGIVVNSKINVRTEYSRNVRAMVHSLVTKGEFQIRRTHRDDKGAWTEKTEKGTESQLRGMLSFIDSVRHFEQNKNTPEKRGASDIHVPRRDAKELDGQARLYRRFLLFTQFFRPTLPFLICEGKTDNVYIRCALRQLAAKHPALATVSGTEIKFGVEFFNYTKTANRILHLGGGTGDMCDFIAKYGVEFDSFKYDGKRHPVIVLIDNDSGAGPIFSAIKKATKSKTDIDGSQPYYFIRDNLYVVPVPKLGGKQTAIEDFFERTVLDTKLGGKVFSRSDKFDHATQYGKHLFSEHVIKKNQKTINFSGFDAILHRISDVLVFHSSKP
ncbi:RNA-directed DNA polymerase [Ralstonia pseudosolanacearum]|uniref:retron Ec67 family RNA-directed DNA polymerase/endonuclease n=1 Tax=Ralstonia pseudosolanacearum TaxID=1310165 RepID=UPI0020047B45|nr:retron Ec67 family RNA-directed DNA polymerase/endonuclease [Ralstonia pseudosolanacearum]MCK4143621.1 RNA-directed DNA polymerase [Ralstonia pseudosolanacearum]